jgi:predicted phage-related endonuclease
MTTNEFDPSAAIERLGCNLVAWIESRYPTLDLRAYLARAAQWRRYDPHEAMIDYLTALYWGRRPGVPTSAAVDAVKKARAAKQIKFAPDEIKPLLLAGKFPSWWPTDLFESDLAGATAENRTGVPVAECCPEPASLPAVDPTPAAAPELPQSSVTSDPGDALALFITQKRAAQIEKTRERQKTCGATDATAILQLQPWRGGFEVYLEKTSTAEDVVAWQEKSANIERMNDGTRLEPVIGQWFADQHPDWRVEGDGQHSFRHLTETWASCSPDRIVTQPSGEVNLLEIKSSEAWPWPQVPDYYVAQVHWQHLIMASHNRSLSHRAFIAARFRGGAYREFPILLDPMRIEGMIKQVKVWWDRHIVGKVPPSIREAMDPNGSIQRLFEGGELDHLDASKLGDKAESASRLVDMLVKWDAREKLAEKTKQTIRGQLGEIIQNHRGIRTEKTTVTWFAVSGKSKTDWEALAMAKGATPAEIEKATTTSPGGRQWRITDRKQEEGNGK